MKKLISVVLMASMIFSISGCKKEEPTSGASPSPPAVADDTENESKTTDTTTSDFKVGMITDVGGVGDQSFNQSAWEGLQKFKEDELGEISYKESHQESDFAPNLDAMIDEENDLIWGIGYVMRDAMLNASKITPDQKFAHVDQGYDDTSPDNLVGVMFKAQEPSFLVGYMAAKTSKTGKLGFVGGMKGEIISQFEYGYKAGVAYAAKEMGKEITVEAQYANSFDDAAMGKAITTSLYSNGADIVFHAAGGVGQGVIDAAKEQNKLVIGVDRDQSDLAPDNMITSALKFVGAAMYQVTEDIKNGNWPEEKTLWYGLSDGACGIPEYAEGSATEKLVDKAVYDETKALEPKIISGEIVVPVNEEEFEAFEANL